MKGEAAVDSYDSATGEPGTAGDVRSNGTVMVDTDATVAGDASGRTVEVRGTVTGEVTEGVAPEIFFPVDVPATAEDLGKLEVKNDDTYVLPPGSYVADELKVESDAHLVVDNLAGPVTLYVRGKVEVSTENGIETTSQDPERFALYVAGKEKVKITNEATVHAVLYAPGAEVEIVGDGEFFGAFVGKHVKIDGHARVHYDEALRATRDPSTGGGPTAELEILRAKHRAGRVRIVARSSADALVPLLVSIDGAPSQPMRWKRSRGRWVYDARAAGDLDGRAITVHGSDGSEASATLD